MVDETNVQQALENSLSVKKGDVVTGTVVKVEADQVIVSIGYKFDGVVPLKELSAVKLEHAEAAVAVGEALTLKVISLNDAKETLVLSKRAIDSEGAVQQLQERFNSGEPFEVVVVDAVKGGLVVDVGIRGFIPASMVDRGFVEDLSIYKGRTLQVIVKELDLENKKVILSAKELVESAFAAQREAKLASLNVGDIVEGTVVRMAKFGVFIDVNGVDGLAHISELSWEHVSNASDVLAVGDHVRAKVIKLDAEAGKLSLSVKAATAGPWELAGSRYGSGDVVEGIVRRLASFGAFVEIAPGVEGLVHISQLSHTRVETPADAVAVGERVQVKILDINVAEQRISLSIKATVEAPARDAAEQEETRERAPRSERKARGERGYDRGPRVDEFNNPNVSLGNDNMNFNLGDKFGDVLKQLASSSKAKKK